MLSAETEAMLSCRSSGGWVGVFGGTIEPGHSHSLQEHDGQDSWTRGIFLKQLHHICSSLEKRSSCQCAQDAALLLLEQNVHRWGIHPVLSLCGCSCQGSPGELLTLTWGLPRREAEICWHFWLILVSKGDFTRWLCACPLLSPPGIIATEQQINKVLLCFLPIWDLEPRRRRPLAEELSILVQQTLHIRRKLHINEQVK